MAKKASKSKKSAAKKKAKKKTAKKGVFDPFGPGFRVVKKQPL
jgi:hypothetical protein